MTARNRTAILPAFLAMIVLSLACTLGGTETPEATGTPLALVTSSPTQFVPTPATLIGLTPTGTPTSTPTATPTPIIGSGPGGCVLKGTYIADVTIPDGTVLAPNAPFLKTWRIRNDGTCSWDAGYQLVYAEGSQMSGPAAVNIPAAAPGQTIDISVNLVAPGVPGDATGMWRLRASNNAIFGRYTVVIKVVGTPTPLPTATATPTLTGGGIWGGTWETNCPGSNCGQVNLVQTGNTVVGTYAGGEGTINGTVSGNRLSGSWTRAASSGSFDFWIEASGLNWHGNWNRTNAWCGHRSGQTDISPCGVSTWYGVWTVDCAATDAAVCGAMSLNQSGDSVGGTYAGGAGSISGVVRDIELTGTYARAGSSGVFKFFMTSDGQQFQGSWNTSNAWCGYRSGSSVPSPCLRN